MTIQQIVDPGKVESELLRMWDGLAKEKMRACLFNLIVFNRISARTDYFRDIVQKVSEKYPCRVLFITSDPSSHKPYLKTAVSVVGNGNIACDYIDIGFSGLDSERVPFVLLPHIIPDLPVSLLWTEDPSKPHPLFAPLVKLAGRVIFDSESSDSLLAFSQKVLALRAETGIDTADLNWARTEGWRDLIASLFHSGDHLDQIKDVRITYNARQTEFFCHLKVQSLYLLSWMASRLGWTFKKASKNLHFLFAKQAAEIQSSHWEKLGPGTVISIDIATQDGHLYQSTRIPTQYHHVTIQISSPEQCQLPYTYVLGRTATGQSLVKEIITKGTSVHYLEMLENLNQLDKDQLC
jgi:glucose-6-phosphate dehydrogenase assembly protein OpcA